jgi:hypothetical protein
VLNVTAAGRRFPSGPRNVNVAGEIVAGSIARENVAETTTPREM